MVCELFDLKDGKKTYTYFVLMLLSQAVLKGWMPSENKKRWFELYDI